MNEKQILDQIQRDGHIWLTDADKATLHLGYKLERQRKLMLKTLFKAKDKKAVAFVAYEKYIPIPLIEADAGQLTEPEALALASAVELVKESEPVAELRDLFPVLASRIGELFQIGSGSGHVHGISRRTGERALLITGKLHIPVTL